MRVLCSVQLNFVRLDAFTQRLHGHTLIRRRVTRLRPKTLLVAATLYCSRDWGDPSIHCALMIISPSLYRGPPRGPPSEGSLPTELTQLSEELLSRALEASNRSPIIAVVYLVLMPFLMPSRQAPDQPVPEVLWCMHNVHCTCGACRGPPGGSWWCSLRGGLYRAF